MEKQKCTRIEHRTQQVIVTTCDHPKNQGGQAPTPRPRGKEMTSQGPPKLPRAAGMQFHTVSNSYSWKVIQGVGACQRRRVPVLCRPCLGRQYVLG